MLWCLSCFRFIMFSFLHTHILFQRLEGCKPMAYLWLTTRSATYCLSIFGCWLSHSRLILFSLYLLLHLASLTSLFSLQNIHSSNFCSRISLVSSFKCFLSGNPDRFPAWNICLHTKWITSFCGHTWASHTIIIIYICSHSCKIKQFILCGGIYHAWQNDYWKEK
jgi:hypothetical protein